VPELPHLERLNFPTHAPELPVVEKIEFNLNKNSGIFEVNCRI
jgi:hypothetical protein